jgi:hypothetical protein
MLRIRMDAAKRERYAAQVERDTRRKPWIFMSFRRSGGVTFLYVLLRRLVRFLSQDASWDMYDMRRANVKVE